MKKWILMLLIVCFALCGCTQEDAPLFAGGTGAPEDPYLIETPGQLRSLSELLSSKETYAAYAGGSYALSNDIDLGGKAFTPMGSRSLPFQGSFDGRGHSISGLSIKDSALSFQESEAYFGLFGVADGSIIQNLTLASGTVSAKSGYAAGIVSYLRDSVLENCHTASQVSITSGYEAGGLAAQIRDGCTVTGCTNAASVTAREIIGSAGGIAAYISCPISDCRNDGAITSGGDAGGICVTLCASAENCLNTGTITADSNAGGICTSFSDGALNHSQNDTTTALRRCRNEGRITANKRNAGGIAASLRSGTLEECTNTGAVTAEQQAGGIFAYFQPSAFGAPCPLLTISRCRNEGTVTAHSFYSAGGICGELYGESTRLVFDSCENTGAVTSAGSTAGGIIGGGSVADLTVTGCSSHGSVTGSKAAGGICGELSPTVGEIGEERSFLLDSCFNSGRVRLTTSGFAGGILGRFYHLPTEPGFTAAALEENENTGPVTAPGSKGWTDDLCGTYAAPEEFQ